MMEDVALQTQLAEIRTDIKGLTSGMADLKATVEAGFAQVVAVQENHAKVVDDHEARLRAIETGLPQLVTKSEAKDDAKRRSVRFYAIGGLVTGTVVPFITVLVTKAVGS